MQKDKIGSILHIAYQNKPQNSEATIEKIDTQPTYI